MDNLIRLAPKAELHVHLEGCLEPAMALEFARRNSIYFRYQSVEEILSTYTFRSLEDFLEAMRVNSSTLIKEEDHYELAYAYLKRAHEDNIVHVEMSTSPQGAELRGLPFERFLEPVMAAFADGARDFDISGGVIVGCLRHLGPDDAFRMIRALTPYRDRILALGLHGAEAGNPPALYERHFEEARELGWRTVAHAGEEGPAEYVYQALDILKVDRIDHGVRCEEDPNLVARLVANQVPLTVCPLSNVCLGVFPSLEEHNFARLLRAGVNVTLNSDDPSYFGGYLNHHIAETARRLSLGAGEIAKVLASGIDASFMPEERKNKHRRQIELLAEEPAPD